MLIVSTAIAQQPSAQVSEFDASQGKTGSIDSNLAQKDNPNPLRKTVDVYLFGGQSNMQGNAKIAALPPTVHKAISNAYFWNKRDFEPLVLGTTKVSTKISEFGPEIGFALEAASESRPVYLVKYSASGMPLHHGWDGNEWTGDSFAPGRRNFYPGENSKDPNIGKLYVSMRSEFQSAVKHLIDAGLTPNIRGMLWMQGEQDAKNQISASSYAASLSRLRKRVAEDMAADQDFPLVFGQVLPYEPWLERFTHRNEIRDQMAACDSRSGKPEAMKNTTMVSTNGFSIAPDTVHYDAAGQLALGRAFGEAMKKLRTTTSP